MAHCSLTLFFPLCLFTSCNHCIRFCFAKPKDPPHEYSGLQKILFSISHLVDWHVKLARVNRTKKALKVWLTTGPVLRKKTHIYFRIILKADTSHGGFWTLLSQELVENRKFHRGSVSYKLRRTFVIASVYCSRSCMKTFYILHCGMEHGLPLCSRQSAKRSSPQAPC